jgi:hypothetical protein
VARPPDGYLAGAVRRARDVTTRGLAVDRPTDPLTTVTHPDPYPYYGDLAATRPFDRDDTLGMWVACSAAAVTDVLTSPACVVRPPAEPVPRALLGSRALTLAPCQAAEQMPPEAGDRSAKRTTTYCC